MHVLSAPVKRGARGLARHEPNPRAFRGLTPKANNVPAAPMGLASALSCGGHRGRGRTCAAAGFRPATVQPQRKPLR